MVQKILDYVWTTLLCVFLLFSFAGNTDAAGIVDIKCDVSKSDMKILDNAMSQAKNSLGDTSFTKMPTGWNSSNDAFLDFLATRVSYVESKTNNIDWTLQDGASTLESLRAQQEKELSALHTIIKRLADKHCLNKEKLARIQTDVAKLQSEILFHLAKNRKLKIDLIYTHLRQGNATSAFYHTDISITAKDISKIVSDLLSEQPTSDLVINAIFKYLFQLPPCLIAEEVMKGFTSRLQLRKQLTLTRILWAAEIVSLCKSSVTSTSISQELSNAANAMIKPLVSQIMSGDYSNFQILERELYESKRYEWELRYFARVLIQQLNLMNSQKGFNAEYMSYVNIFMQLNFKETKFCESKVHAVDEFLVQFESSQFVHDLLHYELFQYLGWNQQQQNCTSEREYLNCVYNWLADNGRNLTNMRVSCYQNYKGSNTV